MSRFRSTHRHRRGLTALLVAVTVSMATLALLAANRALLESAARELLEVETFDEARLRELTKGLKRPDRAPRAEAATAAPGSACAPSSTCPAR